MKIIALLPFKNESWVLETYCKSISKVADMIVAIDDRSTDNGADILKKYNAVVYKNNESVESGWPEFSIRKKLLELGRENGGTHFICLDADEVVSDDLLDNFKSYVGKLIQGQKLELRWTTLWGSVAEERIDGVYKNLYKDFAFCDDGKMEYRYAFLGVSRTPESKMNSLKIDKENGSIIHIQFVNLERARFKQVWYMCSELIKGERNAQRINNTYSIIKEKNIEKKDVEDKKISSIRNFDFSYSLEEDWRYMQVLEWFHAYGIGYFESREIWHIKELHDMFIEKMGREPKIKKYPKILIWLNNIKNRIKK